MMNKKGVIISGFPGIGKTHFSQNSNLSVSDSDSSHFPKKGFPENYIEHIKSWREHTDYILVSSHKEVREALQKEGIHFKLVYPSRDQKQDYIKRYKERGSSDAFIKLIDMNFDNWINEMAVQRFGEHVILKKGQYLSDVIR